MATKKLRNKLSQVVPVMYQTASGQATVLMTGRRIVNMDESRLTQDILDKVSFGVFDLTTTTDPVTTGFSAI